MHLETRSFRKGVERVAVVAHELATDIKLVLEARVVGSQANPTGGFGDEQGFSTRKRTSTSFGKITPTELPIWVSFNVCIVIPA